MTAARERERDRLRADRLMKEENQYRAAQRNLRRLYDGGSRSPATIAVRRRLILRPARGGLAPSLRLLGRNGTALGFYLTGLFEAQTRRQPGAKIANRRPLDTTGADVGWTDLVPHSLRREASTRQLQRALTQLQNARLALLGPTGDRGRYERFQLLRETGLFSRSPYTVPGNVPVFRIPTTFFIDGWVHVLTAAEIALLLVFLDLAHRTDGNEVYLADSRKAEYNLTPEVYERHSALAAYGLIERLAHPDRRDDGTFTRRLETGKVPGPWRFAVHTEHLQQHAHTTVVKALRRRGITPAA